MPFYRLSKKALLDVAEIVSYLHRNDHPSAANKMEDRLFAVFGDLGEGRAIGHTRADLTSRRVLFHACKPYIVIFRRVKQTVEIARVVHGSRDIARFL